MNDKELFESLFKKYRYFNWIPNTSGNIYFSLAKIGQYGYIDNLYASFSHLEGDTANRYIVCTSVKHNTDTKYQSIFNHKTNSQRYIFVAKTNEAQNLSGKLYVIYDTNKNNTITDNIILQLTQMHDVNCRYEQQKLANSGFEKVVTIENNLKNKYDKLVSELDNIECAITKCNIEKLQYHSFDFYIHKNGWCFFNQTTKHTFSKETIESDKGYNKVPRFYKLATYFVKQCLHNHAHHPKNHDSVTGVTDLSLQKEPLHEGHINEILKHQLTLIRKEIIYVKRSYLFSASNPIGFCDYALSLIESFKNLINTDEYQTHKNNISNLKNSVSQIVKHNAIPSSLINQGWLKALFVWNIPIQLIWLNIYSHINDEIWFTNAIRWFEYGTGNTVKILISMLVILSASEVIRHIYLLMIKQRINHNNLALFSFFGINTRIVKYFRAYRTFKLIKIKPNQYEYIKTKYSIRPNIYNLYMFFISKNSFKLTALSVVVVIFAWLLFFVV